MKCTFKLVLAILLLTSCSDIVNVEDISGQTVRVLAPANEIMLTTTTVNFSWDSVEDAEHVKFALY